MPRKIPYSGKKKKEYLIQKRKEKSEINNSGDEDNENVCHTSGLKNFKPVVFVSDNPSPQNLTSAFQRLSASEIEERKQRAMEPYMELGPEALEIEPKDIYPEVIDIPKRPYWNYEMTKEQVETNEEKMFHEWLEKVGHEKKELSFYERNLEVWRQLWRVIEMSDVILFIVDIRHPILHFPPSLYNNIVNEHEKEIIVVFSKIDLVSPQTVFAWKEYFKETFPKVMTVTFSIFSCDKLTVSDTNPFFLQQKTKRQKKRYYKAVGVKPIFKACKSLNIRKNSVEVNWDELIEKYSHSFQNIFEEENEIEDLNIEMIKAEHPITLKDQNNALKDLITIGLVGHPNVGKSSLINAIVGKKVVSASRTPGHTKHFQTIHLSQNVRLCDCPGIVFPALISKPLQPYSSVQYLAERLPLVKILKLDHPDQLDPNFKWSAYAICEAFALSKGFFTARASRPDVYRAANMILRWTSEGRLLLSFKPKGYSSDKYTHIKINQSEKYDSEESESVTESDGIEDYQFADNNNKSFGFEVLSTNDDEK
ncbi:P-loop containing nucleoside triphosphate hydrolase protein [Rozella allomycis CSF55]|uniref:Guanine nucleotide-binding protein-like 1 n=1 Tax=Rozella allomycis (strain CSF55) TaxID=988480 RepID=A0A075B4H0_ROZAC|nr:P-loop containing nucleoside triphosphate hydrolase domain-containing protein [Rozella allomycis CSF55]RKP16770.1 P-loop containing nucleoside triphosphate hydrolase protein [Rozella allomycis CSF55]|eukprot:EPZ36147.1 P-loop containing nucleoside triphosphate hydrolase domain-containing protein [Rozella allomycis CSF55]